MLIFIVFFSVSLIFVSFSIHPFYVSLQIVIFFVLIFIYLLSFFINSSVVFLTSEIHSLMSVRFIFVALTSFSTGFASIFRSLLSLLSYLLKQIDLSLSLMIYLDSIFHFILQLLYVFSYLLTNLT